MTKLKKLSYLTANTIFEGLVIALGVSIISFNWFVKRVRGELKHKYTPLTSFVLVLLIAVSWMLLDGFTHYRGMYKNPVKKILSDKEVLIIKLQNEVKEKTEELQKWEGLKNGDREAIITYVRKVFKDKSDTALAIATCESNITADRVGDGHLTYIQDGIEYGKSYGVFQIRHLKGRPNPEQLKQAKFNIDYAYKVSGEGRDFTGAWVNCSKKIGLLASL